MSTVLKDKAVSEALILESVNLQYDDRLLIELQLQYKKNTRSEQVVYKDSFSFCFGLQNNFCTQHVLNLY